jgi:hypothetical protein
MLIPFTESSLELGCVTTAIQIPSDVSPNNVILQISLYNHSKQSTFLVRSVSVISKGDQDKSVEAKGKV